MKYPELEIENKDRDEKTDTLIKSLLDEEKASKKQKKGPGDVAASAAPARKGKTLAEIEAEEGGPVKESLVGMAQTKRALDRKRREVDVGDTEVVAHTERFEQDTLEVEEEDGIKFEPFNLKQEREEGYFDEDGNYVFRKAAEGEAGEEGKDAWLDSEEAKVVSEAVRKKIEQRAREAEAARRGPLTERQIAQRKADMAALMQPGETVTRALKRLGGAGGAGGMGAAGTALPNRAMGKRERARLLAQQQASGAAGTSSGDPASPEHFTRLTELADELLAEGELEIYSETTETLMRSARMWLPNLVAAPAAPPPGAGAGISAAALPAAARTASDSDDDMFADDKKGGPAAATAPATAVDEDQDMFGDDDDAVGPAGAEARDGQAAAPQAPAASLAPAGDAAVALREAHKDGAGAGPGSAAAAAAGPSKGSSGDHVDYGSWPVKELKRLLQERGVDPSGFVEKGDLIAKVREVVAAGGPAGGAVAGAAGAGAGGAFEAPPGYVFDPNSGYFYSEEAGMYYDVNTGGYCQVSTGKWFYVDQASGNFVEWKQG
ncbi:hypothetical protein GPECTOR_16g687 [Gonium pectorale]|uniref:OCRE domain-containing protein n=1 Tax=Gonium pectorale TaxID=33097 RepID=A0A150GL27_GONPE|nr:hypothetical protein GPECTOR_16g687 [Gonium pectorale]|eukprot:KXZ50512.1 hypothetical protein GPECTOR_16g687 [Gonium pectorale]